MTSERLQVSTSLGEVGSNFRRVPFVEDRDPKLTLDVFERSAREYGNLYDVLKSVRPQLGIRDMHGLIPRGEMSYESMWQMYTALFRDLYVASTPPARGWVFEALSEEVTNDLERLIRVTNVEDGIMEPAPEGSPLGTLSWRSSHLRVFLQRYGIEVRVSAEEVREPRSMKIFEMRLTAMYEAFLRTLLYAGQREILKQNILQFEIYRQQGLTGNLNYVETVRNKTKYFGIMDSELGLYNATHMKQEEARVLLKNRRYTDLVLMKVGADADKLLMSKYMLSEPAGGIENAKRSTRDGGNYDYGLDLMAVWHHKPEILSGDFEHNMDGFTRVANVGGWSFINARDPEQKIMLMNGDMGMAGEIRMLDVLDYLPEFDGDDFSGAFVHYAENYRSYKQNGLFPANVNESDDPLIWVDENFNGHVADVWGAVEPRFRSDLFDKEHVRKLCETLNENDKMKIRRLLEALEVVHNASPDNANLIALAYATSASEETAWGGRRLPELTHEGHLHNSEGVDLREDMTFGGEGDLFVWNGARLPWGYSTVDCAFAIYEAVKEARIGGWDVKFMEEVADGMRTLLGLFETVQKVYVTSRLLSSALFDLAVESQYSEMFAMFNATLFKFPRLRLWLKERREEVALEEREEEEEEYQELLDRIDNNDQRRELLQLIERLPSTLKNVLKIENNYETWKNVLGQKYYDFIVAELAGASELPIYEGNVYDFAFAVKHEVFERQHMPFNEKLGVLRHLVAKFRAAATTTAQLSAALQDFDRQSIENARNDYLNVEREVEEVEPRERLVGERLQMSVSESFFTTERDSFYVSNPEDVFEPVERIENPFSRRLTSLLDDELYTEDYRRERKSHLLCRLRDVPNDPFERLFYLNLQFSRVNLKSVRAFLRNGVLCPLGNVMLARPFGRFAMAAALWFMRDPDNGAVFHSDLRMYDSLNVDLTLLTIKNVAEVGAGVYKPENFNFQPDVSFRAYLGGLCHRFWKADEWASLHDFKNSIFAVNTGCEFGREEAATFEEISLLGTQRMNYGDMNFTLAEQEKYLPTTHPYLPNASWITHVFRLGEMMQNYVDFMALKTPIELHAHNDISFMLSGEQTWIWNPLKSDWMEVQKGMGTFSVMNVPLGTSVIPLWRNEMIPVPVM